MMKTVYGYIPDYTTPEGNRVVVGPYDSLEAAESDAGGFPIVDWEIEDPDLCRNCDTAHERLDMPEDTALIYDAIFPAVLEWSENDDCDMNTLMLNIAEAAAAAIRSPEKRIPGRVVYTVAYEDGVTDGRKAAADILGELVAEQDPPVNAETAAIIARALDRILEDEEGLEIVP